MKIINSNTVNVKWTINKDNYTPYEVPEDIIKIEAHESTAALSRFVMIEDKPLKITIRSGAKKTVATLSRFLLDDYLNYYS